MREDKRGSGIVVKPERARQYPWKSIKGGYAQGGSEGFDGGMTGRDRHREGTMVYVTWAEYRRVHEKCHWCRLL